MARWPLVASCVLSGLLLAGRAAPAADPYYTFQYGDFDVTTRSAERAEDLAHNIARLDKAITIALDYPHQHLPTHIYELPLTQEKALIGETNAAASQYSGHEVTVVTDAQWPGDKPYWGALWGYVEALLFNVEGARLPAWFNLGVPMLFANSLFRLEEVRAGEFNRSTVYYVTHRRFMPLRVLLCVQAGDPQLRRSAGGLSRGLHAA